MPKSDILQVRLAPELRQESDEMFRRMGLETRDAVRLFLIQTLAHGKLPFDVIPVERDENGFSVATQKMLDRSIAELKAGKIAQHDLIED